MSFYIYYIHLTNDYILSDNEPGAVLRVQTQMIHLACSLLGMGAHLILMPLCAPWSPRALDGGCRAGLGKIHSGGLTLCQIRTWPSWASMNTSTTTTEPLHRSHKKTQPHGTQLAPCHIHCSVGAESNAGNLVPTTSSHQVAFGKPSVPSGAQFPHL